MQVTKNYGSERNNIKLLTSGISSKTDNSFIQHIFLCKVCAYKEDYLAVQNL